MVAAGIDPNDADAWITEVGSPSRYSFVLTFTGTAFTHSEETPDMAMEVGESGTFALSGKKLVLTIGESGNIDTYTFDATLSGNELSPSMRRLHGTGNRSGQGEAPAIHNRVLLQRAVQTPALTCVTLPADFVVTPLQYVD